MTDHWLGAILLVFDRPDHFSRLDLNSDECSEETNDTRDPLPRMRLTESRFQTMQPDGASNSLLRQLELPARCRERKVLRSRLPVVPI
jgi:hypothetical protein